MIEGDAVYGRRHPLQLFLSEHEPLRRRASKIPTGQINSFGLKEICIQIKAATCTGNTMYSFFNTIKLERLRHLHTSIAE